jgi:hypothetical protein
MGVKQNLKDVAVAITASVVFAAASSGVTYSIEDTEYYQEKYPSMSLSDAQSLREESSKEGFFHLSCFFTMMFLAEREREKRKKSNPDNVPKAP